MDALDDLDVLAVQSDSVEVLEVEPDPFHNDIAAEMSFYADISIVLLVSVILPIYLVYRVLRSVLSFVNYL